MIDKNLTFEDIAKLLTPAINCNDEAFEFRWLKLLEPEQQRILINTNHEMDMIRVTFPFGTETGRGRIWLKRVYRKIDKHDISKLLEIALYLSQKTDLPIKSCTRINSMISQSIPMEQLLNLVSEDELN
ncbi:hypothetical protein M2131_002182 [Polynucleobacter sphagniphilus]|uniref:hypothetical protein n=1 Tax=Polynucleobacter sphagniphilus TaxID=1743169 RepID=UPI002474BEC9|nr:hypothetical protein [Polynucleobacter sphagniphilus]MDH6422241.1 hypothetical protein [Polynucleobacter sphagniphilus]